MNVKPKLFVLFSKEEPKKLKEIFVAGYPLGKGLSDDLKISSTKEMISPSDLINELPLSEKAIDTVERGARAIHHYACFPANFWLLSMMAA